MCVTLFIIRVHFKNEVCLRAQGLTEHNNSGKRNLVILRAKMTMSDLQRYP